MLQDVTFKSCVKTSTPAQFSQNKQLVVQACGRGDGTKVCVFGFFFFYWFSLVFWVSLNIELLRLLNTTEISEIEIRLLQCKINF